MQIKSDIIKIVNNHNPNVEYFENEFKKFNICPLRWAVVKVDKDFYTVSVAKIIP